MNLKAPPKLSDRQFTQTGSISQAIEKAETNASGNTQPTPDGFPGPTTLLFITSKSDAGTIPKHIIEITKVAKKIGVRVFIASPSNPPFAFEFKKHADKFILISAGSFSITSFLLLRKQVRKYKVNIVHSHGQVAGIYSRLLGLVTRAAIVHSPHPAGHKSGLMDKLLSPMKFETVLSSPEEKSRAVAAGIVSDKREVHIIEDAVDLSKFAVRKPNALAMGKVDPKRPETLSQIRIGAFLRNDSTRGHTAFLKLAREAASQGEFTCAGLSRQQLAKYGSIPPNLEVVGPVADPSAWLYSLDVFVSTSSVDGQVTGASEAIAAGAVCLLSKIPPHEPFNFNQAALLFDAKSTTSFVDTLNSVKQDRALRDMLIGNSRYMLERFNDTENFKHKFIDLYRMCVKRAAGLVL